MILQLSAGSANRLPEVRGLEYNPAVTMPWGFLVYRESGAFSYDISPGPEGRLEY